jgi:hypothetical protein
VAYAVEANASPQIRVGTLTVGGQTVTVTQAANCVYTVMQSTVISIRDPKPGIWANDLVTSAGCAWTAVSDAEWLIVFDASGDGPAEFNYAVLQNDGFDSRTGHITIAGITLTVQQAGTSGTVASLGFPESLWSCEFVPRCDDEACDLVF